MAQAEHVADVLERCAMRLHSAAFDFREPARSVAFADRRIADVEDALEDARRAVRGRRLTGS